jgi:hypothetical protein
MGKRANGNEIGQAMQSLDFLIGIWKTEGEVRAEGNTPLITFKGTDSYEWILEKSFILHKVDVTMGKHKIEAIEVIGGYDKASKKYKMRSFDNQGAFTEMEAHIDNKEVLHIVGANMRSKLIRHNEKKLGAHWERLGDNGEWAPWMDLQLSK